MMTPIPLSQLRRALIIKLRHHGDVLLTSPLFTILREQIPGIEVDALVYAETAPLIELHPAVAQVHTIDREWKRQGLAAQVRQELILLKTLRSRRYDLVIHLTSHPRGAWLARLTGARYSVAPAKKKGGRFWANSFSHLYKSAARRHTVETHLDALRCIGIQPELSRRVVTLVAGYKADGRIDKLLAAHELADSTYIHIHPASRWKFKCWPVEKMAELIGRLQEDGWAIVLTSAPDPAELAMIEAIQRRLARPVTSFAGQLSFKEMAALIQRARLFIGVDSAPMHMAAAVQTPTVAIFGPSGEDNWRPWQVLHRVVASTDHACRPCGADGCAGSKISDCLQQLDVDAVHAAALQLLALPRDEAPS